MKSRKEAESRRKSHVSGSPLSALRPLRLRWLRTALGLAALLAAAYAGRTIWLTAAARWLDVGEPPARADYALVLPGGEQTRPFVAAALINRGYARQALVPQTAQSPDMQDGLELPTVEVIRRVLTLRGLEESQVLPLDSASTSTWEDAQALAAFLRARPHARVLAVTHHYHTRRTRWVFRRVLGREAARVAFVSAPTDGFDATNWWRTKEGLRSITEEYLKFGYYLLRYGDMRAWSLLVGAAALSLLIAVRRARRRRRPEPPRSAVAEAYQFTSTPALSPWK